MSRSRDVVRGWKIRACTRPNGRGVEKGLTKGVGLVYGVGGVAGKRRRVRAVGEVRSLGLAKGAVGDAGGRVTDADRWLHEVEGEGAVELRRILQMIGRDLRMVRERVSLLEERAKTRGGVY